MRKVREVLRLRHEFGYSPRKIGRICSVGRTTAQEYLLRASARGLSWPLPEGMTDEDLENMLYPKKHIKESEKGEIPLEHVYLELKRKNVTLALLWEEYMQANLGGYRYSRFCEIYRKYSKTLNYSMRQEHKAGEKVFVDFGENLKIVDPVTGEFIKTKLFVGVWGASNYTYACATADEKSHSWIRAHTDMLAYFGCVPKAFVPDNLKSAVTKPCRYEPELNPVYAEFAEHYDASVLPARIKKPKDKSKAETGVKLIKRWILARLRNRVFYSLAELNRAIAIELERFNEKKMKRFNKSRKELFETLDKPAALMLPETQFEFYEWKKAKVNINYHIAFEKHDYSIPYTLVGKEIEIQAKDKVIEIYYKGKRVCSHKRSAKEHGCTTVKDHMPPSHQKYAEWTPERILSYAEKCGPSVKELAEKIINNRKYPEQAYKSCLGIIRLEKHFTADRLNKACKRALKYNAYNYSSVKNILNNNLENLRETETYTRAVKDHENIRGPEYYSSFSQN